MIKIILYIKIFCIFAADINIKFCEITTGNLLKSLYDKGEQEFKKLNSYLSLRDGIGVQCSPIFFNLNNFCRMDTNKKNKKNEHPLVNFNPQKKIEVEKQKDKKDELIELLEKALETKEKLIQVLENLLKEQTDIISNDNITHTQNYLPRFSPIGN